MDIRNATKNDLEIICAVFDAARKYMRLNGNMHQWQNGYPNTNIILDDIEKNTCKVCVENDDIIGVFTLFDGPDPCYGEIYDGKWLNDEPYGVIHRIVVISNRKGVASQCIAYAEERYNNLRIDTHQDNIPMRRFLQKQGFVQCGTVIIESGEERIAFHKIINK